MAQISEQSFATKVGVEKDFPSHSHYKASCVKGKKQLLFRGWLNVVDPHIVVIQGLIVCLFLLNYFKNLNIQMESVKSRYFMQF